MPLISVPHLPGVTDSERAFVADLAIKKRESTEFAVKRLLSLRDKGKHIYRNTVSRKEIAARRKTDRFAAASRKANR